MVLKSMDRSPGLFEQFMPLGTNYQWRSDILWLNVTSDLIIAFSFLLFPIALLCFMRKKSQTRYPAILYMFCALISVYGFTHLFSVWTVWNGHYGVHGVIKAFTAVTAMVAIVILFPLMPKMLLLRTPKDLERANARLLQQIEQRKKSEQRALNLQGELARVGRVNTVGHMATVLAHEINQPLLSISASAGTAVQVARSKPVNETLLYECLDDVQKDTMRASDIIRTLRQFVSEKSPTRSMLDIISLIYGAVQLVSRDARKAEIDIVVKKTGAIPLVRANSVHISQVLVNLVCNAIEAIAGSMQHVGDNRVTIEARFENGDVIVSVADTGPGIRDGKDPFKPVEPGKADGMGVGLAICREIVEAHGGALQFTSEDKYGTTFTFNLPVEQND